MSKPFYKLSKYVIFTDHNGREKTLLQDQLFHWNGLRFATADRDLEVIEIPRSKLRIAGARMVPCDSTGKLLDLSINGPDIEIEQIQPVKTGKVVSF